MSRVTSAYPTGHMQDGAVRAVLSYLLDVPSGQVPADPRGSELYHSMLGNSEKAGAIRLLE